MCGRILSPRRHVVGIEVRRGRRDVDSLVKKAAARAYAKPATAILAGVRIGEDVERYAGGG